MISGELNISYSTYSELAVYNFQETGSRLGPGGIWVELKLLRADLIGYVRIQDRHLTQNFTQTQPKP